MSILELEYRLAKGERLELKYRVCDANSVGDGGNWQTEPEVGSISTARKLSCQCHDELSKAFEAMAAGADQLHFDAAIGSVDRLKLLGNDLREELFSKAISRLVENQGQRIRHIIFRHDPSLCDIAFEHIVLLNEFLVFLCGVGRDVLTPRQAIPNGSPQVTAGYQGFSLIDPGALLAQEGAKSLEEGAWDFLTNWSQPQKINFARKRVGCPVNRDQVRQALLDCDIGTIISHFRFDPKSPEGSGFVFAQKTDEDGRILSEDVFTAQELLKTLGAGTAPPHVLLAIGCESGGMAGWEEKWLADDRVWGMVDAVRQAGVRHYIGTSAPFPAAAAARFLNPFYQGLVEGKTIGDALRHAREELRKDSPGGTALGLAFLLFGSPHTAYFCTHGHRVDATPTRWCGDSDNGPVCGRVICPQENGFNELDNAGHPQPRCNDHFAPPAQVCCSAGHVVTDESKLKTCTAKGGCNNTYCSTCSGHGEGLCWKHACHKGHKILGGTGEECSDCFGFHPQERRTVCPRDRGYVSGDEYYCDECFAFLRQQQKIQQANQERCPHCTKFIKKGNNWAGTCHDCGEDYCNSCGPAWHEKTMYCPDKNRSRYDRNAGWLTSLERRTQDDDTLAVPERLREFYARARTFQDDVSTNVTEQTGLLDPMPRLRLSAWDVVMPDSRVLLGVAEWDDAPSQRLCRALQSEWNLPNEPGGKDHWQPPENWLEAYRPAVQLKILRLRSLWGWPIVVAVATVTPVEWKPGRGPTLVPCQERHLKTVEQCLGEWWAEKMGKALPDTYLIVYSSTRWASEVSPTYRSGSSGFLRVHVEHREDQWQVVPPHVDGKSPAVEGFVGRLMPKNVYQQRQERREQIEDYLKDHDFITLDKAEKQIQERIGTVVQDRDIDKAFDQLAATGKYHRDKVNEKPSLRLATSQERARLLARQWWLEGAIGLLVLMVALLGATLPFLYEYRGSVTVGVIACAVGCQLLGHAARRFLRFLRQTVN